MFVILTVPRRAEIATWQDDWKAQAGPTSRWADRADRDEGRRSDGLTTPEREELSRLKRELRQVKLEREILAKATAWFARETGSMPSGGSSS